MMMNLLLIVPSVKKRHYVDTCLIGSLFMANHKRIYYINAKIVATKKRQEKKKLVRKFKRPTLHRY